MRAVRVRGVRSGAVWQCAQQCYRRAQVVRCAVQKARARCAGVQFIQYRRILHNAKRPRRLPEVPLNGRCRVKREEAERGKMIEAVCVREEERGREVRRGTGAVAREPARVTR